MKHKKTNIFKSARLLILTPVLFTLIPLNANAAKEWINEVNITRTLSDIAYGGCMIQVDQHVSSVLPNCPASGWVSLDCDAVYQTQSQANTAWTSALFAYGLNRKVSLYIDDQKKHNSYCVARRIDVLLN